MSWVCFRPLSTPQNICSEGQRILFLSLIYHRHTHGLNLNQPDDSTYVLLDVVRMPHCCVSPPCLPENVALKRTLTLQRADGIQVTDISWRSRAASSKAHPWWWYPVPASPFLAQMRIVTSFLSVFSLLAKVPRFPFFHCNDLQFLTTLRRVNMFPGSIF